MSLSNSLNDRFAGRDVGSASFAIGDETTNEIIVTCTLKDREGRPMQKQAAVAGYISSAADGSVVQPPTSGLTIAGETLGIVMVNGATNTLGGNHFMVVCEAATGIVEISITETGADTFYVVLIMPNGDLVVSDAVTHAA